MRVSKIGLERFGRSVLRFAVVMMTTICVSGCLYSHTSMKTVRENEVRRTVSFESPKAAKAFQERALSQDANDENLAGWTVGIPFVLYLARSKKLSQNAYYNDQLTLADTDDDGLISQSEALAYNPKFFSEPIASTSDDSEETGVKHAAAEIGELQQLDIVTP
jgi:hypothetical protein